MRRLAVSEIFGPTVQGEGPAIGWPAAFLRLAGCNLACTWCDTKYTWDWQQYDPAVEVHKMEPEVVVAQLEQHRPAGETPLCVVSGGEPLLQQTALAPVLAALREHNWRLEMETAGTIAPAPATQAMVHRFVVSPKLAHSGNAARDRLRPAALAAFNTLAEGHVAWKFVAQQVTDLDEVARLVETHHLRGPIYIMPEGTTAAALRAWTVALLPETVARGWRFTPRLHVELWGARRGV